MSIPAVLLAFALVFFLLALFLPFYPCIIGAILCVVAALLIVYAA